MASCPLPPPTQTVKGNNEPLPDFSEQEFGMKLGFKDTKKDCQVAKRDLCVEQRFREEEWVDKEGFMNAISCANELNFKN